jgi:hypothetical protein
LRHFCVFLGQRYAADRNARADETKGEHDSSVRPNVTHGFADKDSILRLKDSIQGLGKNLSE